MQVKIPGFDPIQFLVGRKFPHQRNWGSFRLKMIPPETRPPEEVDRLIQSYEEELRKKTPAEIAELVRIEEEAEQIERDKFEEKQWFNSPDARADFGYWRKAAYWTLDEAIALSLGRDPNKVNSKNIDSKFSKFKFTTEYKKRFELAERARFVGELGHFNAPRNFLAWAKRTGLSYHPELDVILMRNTDAAVDWKARHDAEAAAHAASKAELERVRTALAANDAKPLGQRERESLLKLVIGLAIDAYGYDPHAFRSPITKEISDILARRGIPLDEDTVRKYLQAAKELLPPPETEQDR